MGGRGKYRLLSYVLILGLVLFSLHTHDDTFAFSSYLAAVKKHFVNFGPENKLKHVVPFAKIKPGFDTDDTLFRNESNGHNIYDGNVVNINGIDMDNGPKIVFTEANMVVTTEEIPTETPLSVDKHLIKSANAFQNLSFKSFHRDVSTITSLSTPGKAINLLLLSYFRSGSSFVGDVFNHDPLAHYWFEPLHTVLALGWKILQIQNTTLHALQKVEDVLLRMPDGSYGTLPGSLQEKSIGVLSNLFHCKLYNVSRSVFTEAFVMRYNKSIKSEPYVACYKDQHDQGKRYGFEDCIPLLVKACKQTDLHVIKTIRVGSYLLDDYITRYPDLKVIHYVRDPRGMLVSRGVFILKRSKFKHMVDPKVLANALDKVTTMCARLRHDIYWANYVSKKWPHNIVRVRYEDLAQHPMDTVEYMYRFLGRSVPKAVTSWLLKSTAAESNNGALGTVRKNSTATSERWRDHMDEPFHKRFLDICKDVIEDLGYSLDK